VVDVRTKFRRLLVKLGLKKPNTTISAVFIHADGTREDLGVVARGWTELESKRKG
jgi:hypothetical protein